MHFSLSSFINTIGRPSRPLLSPGPWLALVVWLARPDPALGQATAALEARAVVLPAEAAWQSLRAVRLVAERPGATLAAERPGATLAAERTSLSRVQRLPTLPLDSGFRRPARVVRIEYLWN